MEWISTKDRLPDKGGNYLVRYTNGTATGVETFNKKYRHFFTYDSDEGTFPEIAISHWMPLPPPPKGTKEKP